MTPVSVEASNAAHTCCSTNPAAVMDAVSNGEVWVFWLVKWATWISHRYREDRGETWWSIWIWWLGMPDRWLLREKHQVLSGFVWKTRKGLLLDMLLRWFSSNHRVWWDMHRYAWDCMGIYLTSIWKWMRLGDGNLAVIVKAEVVTSPTLRATPCGFME